MSACGTKWVQGQPESHRKTWLKKSNKQKQRLELLSLHWRKVRYSLIWIPSSLYQRKYMLYMEKYFYTCHTEKNRNMNLRVSLNSKKVPIILFPKFNDFISKNLSLFLYCKWVRFTFSPMKSLLALKMLGLRCR